MKAQSILAALTPLALALAAPASALAEPQEQPSPP
jgi:hypothetical protein